MNPSRPETPALARSAPSVPLSGVPALLWLGYVFFVVYGSLVPLHYKARPLHEAWRAFQHIPFLNLGLASRADWVANGVLYVPVGFLTVFLLSSLLRRIWPLVLPLMAAVFCVALAVGVEFTQLFFPPRTVSLNDILAELIGSTLGIILAARFGSWFATLLHSFLNDTGRLLVLGLDAYAAVYLAFSMFPFDFLLSWTEISDKLNSENWGWWVAGAREHKFGTQVIKLVAEIALAVPFGVLLARLMRPRRASYALAAFLGLALGSVVEVVQFFIASGVAQGLSVVTRALGLCVGVALFRYAHRGVQVMTLQDAATAIRPWLVYLAVPYGLTLLHINGWTTTHWHGPAKAALALARVNFLPFYYHYFTTEAIALFSLAAVAMSYLPLGLAMWVWGRSTALSALLSALLAGAIETGKLFINGAHPDPTNLLIAAAAASGVVSLLKLFAQSQSGGAQTPHTAYPTVSSWPQPADESALSTPGTLPRWPSPPVSAKASLDSAAQKPGVSAWLAMLVCLATVLVWLAGFPTFRLGVATVLLTSCSLVWWQPRWAFALVPALMPVFDLAPWSGRFFLDEFDALVLSVLSIAFLRASVLQPRKPNEIAEKRPKNHLLALAVGLLALSFTASLLRGLSPWAWPDLNSFNNYFSNYNALRIVKGAMWAALMWHLSGRFRAVNLSVRMPFAWGMAIGLAMTVLWILWERLAFVGFLNFAQDYRVTGPFSVTHTGGAYIDAFLAAAIPLVIALVMVTRSMVLKLAGVALILAGTYALMVTFSRAGYASLAVTVLVLLVLLPAPFVRAALQKQATAKWLNVVVPSGLALAMVLVAWPVYNSAFMQTRLASSSADFAFRKAHWADALALRETDAMTWAFGMGAGQFPQTKYWRSTLHSKIATYQLQTERQGKTDNTFLRLSAGEPIGVEQFVAIKPGQTYRLKFDVRPSHANTKVTVPICEKWLLTSARCVSPSFDLGALKGAWRSVELTVDTQSLAPSQLGLKRPIKLALTHSLAQSTIDLDNLQLISSDNINLLRNGDFSQDLDHWYFSIAGTLHAHWRTHSLPVAVLFDQGWLGVAAWSLFLGAVLWPGLRKAWAGDALTAGAVAALLGFLVGSLMDTQIDAPRILFLLLMLAWMASTGPRQVLPEAIVKLRERST